jgi:hypothetical protein
MPFLNWAQKPLVWELLGLTTYNNDFSNDDAELTPHFPEILMSQYDGEEVVITGYLIPVDIEANKYALSKNPFTSCFFCGNAGPETVVELVFETDPGRFATDEYLMIKGVLKLNHRGNGLFFTLKNAVIHG